MPHSRRLPFALVMLALCAGAGPLFAPIMAAAAEDRSPDLSTPQSALVAFANALLAGDNAGIRAAAVGSDEDYHAAEAMGVMVSALRRLSDAAVARYGPDNAISTASANLNLTVALRGADVKVDGDVATIVRKDKPAEAVQAKLVRRDGRWRVDLASLPKQDMAQVAAAAPVVDKAANELAAEIAAGRYKTAADALAAFGAKMAPPPTTRPGAVRPQK